jgi:glycosyltransferase involved in cell wall biosynthesis
MRILFLTDSDITHENGYRTRVLTELIEATKRGARITVLSFQHLRYLFYVNGALEYSRRIHSLGCDVFVVWILPHFMNRLLVRLVQSYKTFWLKHMLTRFRVRLVHCHNLSAAHVASMSKASHHILSIFDVHGAVPEERVYDGRKPSVVEYDERAEKQALKSADAVICVSASLSRHLQSKYGFRYRELVLPCAVDTGLFRFSLRHRNRLRSKWHLNDDQPVFVHSGGAQRYQQLGVMARLFREVLRIMPASKMLLLVWPSSRDTVAQTFRLAGVPQESFLICSTDHWRVFAFLSAADIALLIREDSIVNRVASPTKFGEYLACGVPVVASPHVDAVRDAIKQGRVGFLLHDGTEQTLQQLCMFARSVVAHREEWSERCRGYARSHLSWDHYGDELVRFYASLSSSQGYQTPVANDSMINRSQRFSQVSTRTAN